MKKTASTKRLAIVSLCAFVSSVGMSATDLAGADLTVTSLDPDGYVNTGAAATLTVDIASDVSYSGSISGNISLVKKGAGVLPERANGSNHNLQIDKDIQ